MAVHLNIILLCKLAAFSLEKVSVYLSEENVQSPSKRLSQILWGAHILPALKSARGAQTSLPSDPARASESLYFQFLWEYLS